MWRALEEFDAQSLEAEALWGQPIRECTEQLRTVLRTLNAALQAYVANERSGGEDFKMDKDFGKQIRSQVSSSPTNDENRLNVELSSAIKSIEDVLRPHLRRA